MSKMKLEFDLNEPHEKNEAKRAVHATEAYTALRDIADYIFRPARKHGYPDQDLQKLVETTDSFAVIDILEDKFYEILRDNNIDLDDLD